MQEKRTAMAHETETNSKELSRKGLLLLLEQNDEEKREMWRKSQKDPVGFLYELKEFLCQTEKEKSSSMVEKFNSLTECVKEISGEYSQTDRILCFANEYGMASEENGFRNGFFMAMRFFLGVMEGGVC